MYSPPFPRLKSYVDVIDLAVEYGVKSVEPFCMFEFENPDIEKARRVKEYADADALNADVAGLFRKGDIVLVKGSHGMHMEKTAEYILETGAEQQS